MLHHAGFKKRVISSQHVVHQSVNPITLREEHYKMWKQDSMAKAMEDIRSGCSIRSASIMYGIPKSTLADHVNGKSTSRSGGAYLTAEEEHELVDFLLEAASVGFPRTRKDILAIVQNIVSSRKTGIMVTMGWMDRFIQRHPEVALRTAIPLSHSRAKATDPEALMKYFKVLETCFIENEIVDPDQVFNCDETGLPMNPLSEKVVAAKGAKHVSCITGGNKSQTTVLACSCATGTVLPPFVVLDRQSLHPSYACGEVPGTHYGMSSNGWMNQELFQGWFTHVFLECIPPKRPVILLMDGHSSHYCPETIRMAAEHQVVLFALPPNTTHITQPLDRACFAPLKVEWREECHRFQTLNPGKVINRLEFSGIFSRAWYKAMKMENIIAGFRVTGIYPLNADVLLKDLPIKSGVKQKVEVPTLAYIPFLSPFPSHHRYHSSSPGTPDVSIGKYSQSNGTVTSDSADTPPMTVEEPDGSLTPKSPSICMLAYRQKSAISKFLDHSQLHSTSEAKKPANPGKVLTSIQNLQILEEKEKLKAQKEEKRLQRQQARLKKRIQKDYKLPIKAVTAAGKTYIYT